MLLQDVRLSVRPSVTRRYCVRKAKRILKLFTTSAMFRRGPLTGSLNAEGMKKNRNFRPTFRFISETIQDRAIVTMESQ